MAPQRATASAPRQPPFALEHLALNAPAVGNWSAQTRRVQRTDRKFGWFRVSATLTDATETRRRRGLQRRNIWGNARLRLRRLTCSHCDLRWPYPISLALCVLVLLCAFSVSPRLCGISK